ncbi:MAG TPA: DUF4870 domain-containing protein [Anaerolineae bacterium]
MTTQVQRTQEERLLAALAHAAIITGAMAPVAGILIYLTQKEKSAYAAGQALQAAVYQLLGLLVIIIAWACWGGFYALTFIPLIRNAEQYQDAPPPIFWLGLGSMICPFIVMGLWGLYGLYGALRAWAGADFRYAFVGRLVTERLTN